MSNALDYSSPQQVGRVARSVGSMIAVVAMVSAVVIVWRSATLAHALIGWGSCGTGRHEVAAQLLFYMPFACVVPGGCWWCARLTVVGLLLSRLSFFASVTGWALSAACIFLEL